MDKYPTKVLVKVFLFAESGTGMMPIGMEMMSSCSMAGMQQPKLVLIKDSDSTTLQHVKAVIIKMAAQDPKARLAAVQVMHVMAEITGELFHNQCLISNTLFVM